jgi:hypothetical protein
LTIEAIEIANLVIVEKLGDHGRDVTCGCAGSDVLAISSTVSVANGAVSCPFIAL